MDDVLSSEETAKLLGVSRAYLYTLIKSGDLSPLESESILSRRSRLQFSRQQVEALRSRRLAQKAQEKHPSERSFD